ncbi:MAG: phage Gp37/Gp68 family protein [Candidatus Marinimicrobia bacterium]|nr:phage Gp37/Gp68 family protein [Candidatus Neomarinimicrobiota bacterium]
MTKIEWTDRTWNPNQGCTKVSEGCKNCYAEKMHKRLNAMGIDKYQNDFNKVQLWLQSLTEPTKWKKPSKVFVNSMSDTFHRNLTFEKIDEVFKTMKHCNKHTYQVLTKRPDRALEFIEWKRKQPGIIKTWKFSDNIWMGVTIENQEQANKRIPLLLEIPAKVRFVSVEPMLGPVDLEFIEQFNSENKHVCYYQVLKPIKNSNDANRPALNWVICGGESGHNARPMHPDWVRSLRDQCEAANVPFFFKQWGMWHTKWVNMTNNTYVFKMYTSYQQFTQKNWVNKGDACIDMDGKILKRGADFIDANYPVCIMSKTGNKQAGRTLGGKEYKQFPK